MTSNKTTAYVVTPLHGPSIGVVAESPEQARERYIKVTNIKEIAATETLEEYARR